MIRGHGRRAPVPGGWFGWSAGLALAAACAIAIACGAGRPAVNSAAPEAAAPGDAPAETRREIERLDREIDVDLSRARIAPPLAGACSGATCQAALAEPFVAPSTRDPDCHPAASNGCADTCSLATSICRSQDRICRLARKLPGDDWAANKCTRARASCEAAHDSCCGCML